MSKDYSNLEGLIGNVKESIRNAYDKGYKQGFKDAAKSEYEHDHAVVKAYNDGQAYILDKIMADIEKITSRYTISHERRDAIGHVEWSDKLIKESEILEIIDKYREVNE